MNQEPGKQLELQQLVTALIDEQITGDQQQRLSELLRNDPSARTYYLYQMDMHACLRWTLHQRKVVDDATLLPANQKAQVLSGKRACEHPPKATDSPRWHRFSRWVPLTAAACLIIAAIIWWSRPTPPVGLAHDWNIEPIGNASYQVVERRRIFLESGEIHVTGSSATDTKHDAFIIDTPSAQARAAGTEFYIGAHSIPSSSDSKGNEMRNWTRVLVLAGTITLSNSFGSVDGTASELLATDKNSKPVSLTVRANTDFAIDLYRELGRDNTGQNLFFSPYSINVALTMVLEGARGETADEMGRILHFPKQARRIGDDKQRIPWQTSLIHSGHAEISKRFFRPETPSERIVQGRIKKMQTELTATNSAVRKLSSQKQYVQARAAAKKAKALADAINREMKKLNSIQLKLANALWGEQTYPFRQEFVEAINRHYVTGDVVGADFINNYPRERLRINDWVAEQTGGHIKNMMPQLAPEHASLLRLVLVNAIYFKGDWVKPFRESSTRDRDFNLLDGRKLKVATMSGRIDKAASYGAIQSDGAWFTSPTMRRTDVSEAEQNLYPKNGFQILALPYRGESISMIVFVPQQVDGLVALESLLTASRLRDWISRIEQREVLARLPKFSMSTDYDLVNTLQSLGMVRAFNKPNSPDGADFGGMSASADSLLRMYLSQVAHKAFVDVNEKGTVATAATAISFKKDNEEALRVPFIPWVRADRPFLFLIRDMKTGTILFMGRVMKPIGAK